MSHQTSSNGAPKKALAVADRFNDIFTDSLQQEIAQIVDLYAPPQQSDVQQANPELLAEAEIIISGWGAPKMDGAFLECAPKLKAVFYGAGTVRRMVTEDFWRRKIMLCGSWGANAVPVSEYTLSQILFGLKLGNHTSAQIRRERVWKYPKAQIPGGYGTVVGLISLGMVGRRVAALLQNFDVKVLAYDPFVDPGQAKELGVELVTLDEIFIRSNVVSLHTPWLKETEKMIRGRRLESMMVNSTFINTARGAVVDEPEMIEVLKKRPDIFAVLDVVYPEPPAPDSALWDLPNVILTPHIAGAVGSEPHRCGRYIVDELRRYINGEPLKWQITEEMARTMA